MRPLKIGINALFRGRPTGVANYIINLVKNLAQLDKENEYYIFLIEENKEYFNLEQDNFHEMLCFVKTENPILRRMWEQIVLPKLVHDKDIDILHCPVNIIPILVQCRSIVTFLDCQYFNESSRNTLLRKKYHHIFMRLSMQKADAIITISDSMKSEIIQYLGGKRDNIHVTHLGQDTFSTVDQGVRLEGNIENVNLSRKYILFVGFPQYRKNLSGLVKAFASAMGKMNEPYDLVICGDMKTKIESDYNNILKTINRYNIENQVKFIDYLENEELRALMVGAEIFVFPSFYEGFGLPVLEAMACGTPVLVSDIPVMHEIVDDAGMYVNPYNQDDISRGICELLLDSNLRQRLGKKGWKRAQRFTWKMTAEKTLECYQTVFKGNIE